MKNYIISAASCADLSAEHFASRGIEVLYFHYTLGGKEYVDDLGKTLSLDEFYARMVKGEITHTSQPTIGDYMEYFGKLLKQGKDILHICLSSGLSGDINSATQAAEALMKDHPGQKIICVDSLGASSGYGLIADKAADLRDEGKTIEENAAWLEEHRLNMNHVFFSTDLTFYVRGGRVTKTAGFVGNLLHICPVLNMNSEGKLIPREKAHGAKKAGMRIVEIMEELADNGLDYSDKVYMCNSACPEIAKPIMDVIKGKFPKIKGDVILNPIGPTIGAHSGPGTVAVFFWGKKRGL